MAKRRVIKSVTYTLPTVLLDEVAALAKASYRTKSGCVQMLLERGLEVVSQEADDLDENAA